MTLKVDKNYNLNIVNPEWLRYFIYFVEKEFNLNSTADYLCITPQALNQSIIGIEKILNLKIVEKVDKNKKLTEAGEIVYKKTLEILKNYHEMEEQLNDLRNEEAQGTVTIANCSTAWTPLISETIREISLNYPKIFLKVYFLNIEKTEESLLKNKIDFALLPCEIKVNKDIEFIKGPNIPVVIVGKPNHDTNKLIHPNHLYWKKALENWDVEYNIIGVIDDINTSFDIVKKGIAITITPENNLTKDLVRDKILEVKYRFEDEYSFKCLIAHNKTSYMSTAKKIFIKTLIDFLNTKQ